MERIRFDLRIVAVAGGCQSRGSIARDVPPRAADQAE